MGVIIIRDITKSTKENIKAFVISMESTNNLDVDSIDTLKKIKDELEYKDIRLLFTRVQEDLKDKIGQNIYKGVEEEKIFFYSVRDAVSAAKNNSGK